MKKLLIALILSLFPGIGWGQSYSGLPAPTVIYTGITTWQSGTTYPQGAVVVNQGLIYQSLQNGNVGNNPQSTPAYWSGTVGAVPVTNSVIVADTQTGSDCGAKLNAAITSLSGGPGEMWMSPACGNITTSVTLGTNQHLFVHPGTYNLGATIQLGQNASIECDPSSDVPSTNFGSCYFQQTASSNLPEMFLLSGTNAAMVDVSVDGNAPNNSSAGPNILITSLRGRLDHVSTQRAKTHGITIGNGSTNAAAGTKLDHIMSLNNTVDGIHCSVTSDVSIGGQSEVENNGGNGVTLTNCGGARLSYNDISGNALDGISVSGVSTAAVSAFNNLITDSFFSQNGHHDIEIQGWDGAHATYASLNNSVISNIFQGSTNHGDNLYDAIHIQDSGYNILSVNVIQDPFGSSYQFKTGIDLISVNGELGDVVTGNNIQTPGTPITTVASTTQGLNSLNGVNGSFTGAATFPSSNGIVFNTSTTASRVATSTDIQTVIGSGVYDASGAAATAITTAETFSANAANITSGTINPARIPTLNQSTTGNAATATALAAAPTLCTIGQAPTGIAANGNATGCATWLNANTTGTAGNLSGTPTLPNGTSAVTQTTGDSSGMIATDLFVANAIASSGGGNVSSIGTPLNGQIAVWASPTLLTAATPTGTGSPVQGIGPSIQSPVLSGTPVAPTAAAGTSTTQIATTQFAYNNFLYTGGNYNSFQFTQTPTYMPALGSIWDVDGFPSTGGTYRGTWSSTTAYNRFDTVTSGGVDWIAVNGSTNVTPAEAAAGSSQFWLQFDATGSGLAATQADAAFFWTKGQVQLNSSGFTAYASAVLYMGAKVGGYNKNGDWTMPANTYGYTMSLFGMGRGQTWVHQTASTLQYMITSPNVSSSGGQTIQGISLDANLLAGGCLSHHTRRSLVSDIVCWNPQQQPGGTVGAAMWLGSGADSYETLYQHLLARSPTYSGLTPAYGTASVTSGAITGITWTSTGANLNLPVTAGPGLVAYFTGKGPSSTSYLPCGTMPVVTSIALTGGSINTSSGVSGITFSNAGVGCGPSGTIYVRVQAAGTLNEAFYLNGADTTVDDIVSSGDFKVACEYVNGPFKLEHEHPYCAAPYEIEKVGTGTTNFIAPEMDSPIQYGMYITGSGANVVGGFTEYNAAGTEAGVGDYLIDAGATNFSIASSGCYAGSSQTGGGYAKYTGTTVGPLTPSSTFWPSSASISGIQENCDGTTSLWGIYPNYATLNSPAFTGNVTVNGSLVSVAGVPSTIADLVYWFKSDVLPLATNGNSQGILPDSTPFASRSATQAASPSPQFGATTGGATYTSSGLNSLPTVAFPGNSSGRYLIEGAPNLLNMTVFVVFKPATVTGNQDFISGPLDALALRLEGNQLDLLYDDNADLAQSSTTVTTGTWYQANVTYTGGTGAYAFRIARATAGSGTAATESAVSPSSAIGFNLGGTTTGTSEDLNCSVAEIIVYQRVLTGTEISNVEAYLHTKWGI